MKDIEYDDSRPLRRLEIKDKAIIKVNKFPDSIISDKDKKKYGHVPNGVYEAICVGNCKLECKEYPVLSGVYTYWYGSKWGTSYGIYADEVS